MHALPDLPYAYDALGPHIDAKTMEIHHSKHHATYVQKLNDALNNHDDLKEIEITELMQNLKQVPEEIRTAVRNNGGGHANHSLFWTIMSPEGGGEPGGELSEQIEKAFGSFGGFKTKFKEASIARFGSGWTWLCKEPDGLHICTTPNQDNPLMDDKDHRPILGLDVWEHAYYLNYQNRRPDYVDAWWNVVNWKEVERLFALS